MTLAVSTAARPQHRTLFIATSLLIALIAVVGFWPTYYGPLVNGTLVQPLVIHFHVVVFTGWLVLFFAQAVLAATRKVAWHIRIGRVGIAYGFLLIGVGLYTGVARAAARPLGGPAERLLLSATADMVMFAAFFGAAVMFRRKPQLHKRLMTVAAVTLLVAAVARMSYLLPGPPIGRPIGFLIWCLPIVMAMIYDFRHQRVVHLVYLLGLATLLVRRLGVPSIAATPEWTLFATWVFGWAA
jgi:hypothetical protein